MLFGQPRVAAVHALRGYAKRVRLRPVVLNARRLCRTDYAPIKAGESKGFWKPGLPDEASRSLDDGALAGFFFV
jgi:hypothetical protein